MPSFARGICQSFILPLWTRRETPGEASERPLVMRMWEWEKSIALPVAD
jgi:hypothetical protein